MSIKDNKKKKKLVASYEQKIKIQNKIQFDYHRLICISCKFFTLKNEIEKAQNTFNIIFTNHFL